MTYYEDMTPCPYFGSGNCWQLKAIGWLDAEHPRPTGDVDRAFVDRLIELLVNPWQPYVLAGYHPCPFCRISRGPSTFATTQGDGYLSLGGNNLFVPGNGCLFVAPSTIIHYIDAHDYAPPLEFQQAVLDCPPMRSLEYFRSILRNGPQGFARLVAGPSPDSEPPSR